MSKKLTTGELGWIGLTIYVVAVDSWAWKNDAKGKPDETMSVAFGKSLQRPLTRTGTLLAWGLVTSHLFWKFPLPGTKTLRKAVTTFSRPKETISN